MLTKLLFFAILTTKGGESLKDRIKKLRKDLGMTQQEFADKLGLKRQTVAAYEIGKIEPSNSILLMICDKFPVEKEWLQNGTGEMHTARTRNQEIQRFANDIMEEPDESFKKRFIQSLSRLNERDWETILKIVNELTLKEG